MNKIKVFGLIFFIGRYSVIAGFGNFCIKCLRQKSTKYYKLFAKQQKYVILKYMTINLLIARQI